MVHRTTPEVASRHRKRRHADDVARTVARVDAPPAMLDHPGRTLAPGHTRHEALALHEAGGEVPVGAGALTRRAAFVEDVAALARTRDRCKREHARARFFFT